MTASEAGRNPQPPASGAEAHQIVRSPEQVELHLPVAGPASRILAYAIDSLVIFSLIAAVIAALFLGTLTTGAVAEWLGESLSGWIEDLDPGDPGSVLSSTFLVLFVLAFLLIQVLAEWGYFVVSEMVSGGRSLGKRVVGLRVVCDGGRPIDLRASMVRNLLRIADMLPASYLAGLVSMVISPEGKRLGDIVAGTLVVRLDRPAPAPPIEVDLTGRAGEFRFERGELARVGATERALLRRTLRRLDGLEGDAAETVLARSVAALAQRLGREAPAAQDQRPFLEALFEASRRR